MSEVKRYGHISYLVEATPQILSLYPAMTVYVLSSDFEADQSELAALREELASAKRNEHNSEVAYKAAIEKQEELRKDLDWNRLCRSTSEGEWMEALTAAEQRNADENVAADCYWAIADVLGTESGWSVLEHVQWMRELLTSASEFLHDIPESEVGGNSSAVELCRRIRMCLDGAAPGYLEDIKPTESGASE